MFKLTYISLKILIYLDGGDIDVAKNLMSDQAFRKLPHYFDFPVGTMFWAKPLYLKNIAKLNVQNQFLPSEPLPVDGTILHAWERVLGAMASIDKSRYALTSVPGLTR